MSNSFPQLPVSVFYLNTLYIRFECVQIAPITSDIILRSLVTSSYVRVFFPELKHSTCELANLKLFRSTKGLNLRNSGFYADTLGNPREFGKLKLSST